MPNFSTALILLVQLPSASPSLNCGLTLPTRVQPGQLVIARGPAGMQLNFAGRTLRQAPSGEFVFGIGRDASKQVVLKARHQSCTAFPRIAVRSRSYKLERVNGVPQQTVTPNPATAKRIAKEQALIQAARGAESPRLDWLGRFQWPARGRISGVYGSQRIVNGTPLSPHLALDIAAPTGTAFSATLPGVVTLAHQDMVLTGKTLIVDHGFGINSVYIHMNRLDAKLGDQVKAGQILGAIGATGRASGPHLHFQVQWFQEKLDPALLMPE